MTYGDVLVEIGVQFAAISVEKTAYKESLEIRIKNLNVV